MTLKYSIDKILHGNKEDCFIHNLTPNPKTYKEMHDIKMLVRQTIREAFQRVNLMVKRNELAELTLLLGSNLDDLISNTLKREEVLADFMKVKPKFSSQGSSVYGTLNTPCQHPQQMDIDDGAYLPMTTFEEGGPTIAKEAFFKIVDTALEGLCKARKWTFIGDKATCVRIIVNEDFHIDVPLYAIPDKEYTNFTESSMDSSSYKSEDPQTVMLNPNQVYLAMRNEVHWKASDPREVSDWFKSEVKLHGPQLKRVCRYLKAWRDNTWADTGPSSITLMACVVEVFNNPVYSKGFSSDTEALLIVTNYLSQQLEAGVKLPITGEILYPRKHDKDRPEILTKAKDLNSNLLNALSNSSTNSECLAQVINVFGRHLPVKPELIESIQGLVRQTAPQVQSKSPVYEIQDNFKAG